MNLIKSALYSGNKTPHFDPLTWSGFSQIWHTCQGRLEAKSYKGASIYPLDNHKNSPNLTGSSEIAIKCFVTKLNKLLNIQFEHLTILKNSPNFGRKSEPAKNVTF